MHPGTEDAMTENHWLQLHDPDPAPATITVLSANVDFHQYSESY